MRIAVEATNRVADQAVHNPVFPIDTPPTVTLLDKIAAWGHSFCGILKEVSRVLENAVYAVKDRADNFCTGVVNFSKTPIGKFILGTLVCGAIVGVVALIGVPLWIAGVFGVAVTLAGFYFYNLCVGQ